MASTGKMSFMPRKGPQGRHPGPRAAPTHPAPGQLRPLPEAPLPGQGRPGTSLVRPQPLSRMPPKWGETGSPMSHAAQGPPCPSRGVAIRSWGSRIPGWEPTDQQTPHQPQRVPGRPAR